MGAAALAAAGTLSALYVLAMALLLAGISGESAPPERQAWLLGAGYAVAPLLCALAGVAGIVAAIRRRLGLAAVLTVAGWVVLAVLVALLIAPPGGQG